MRDLVGEVPGHTRAAPLVDAGGRLAELARRLLDAPAALVWLSDPDVPPDDTEALVRAGAEAVRRGAPVAVADLAEISTRGDGVWPGALPGPGPAELRAVLAVPVPAAGAPSAALCVGDTRARRWSTEDVQVLEKLAVSVAAELDAGALWRDLETSRTRSDLAMSAAGIGSFDWDLRTGRLVWDDRLQEIFGYTDATFRETIEDFKARLHPDDVDRVSEVISRAIDLAEDFTTEYRVVRPDGEVSWVQARGRVLLDESGARTRLLGAAYETTALREGEARVGRVLESMSTAFFSVDRDWRFTYVNAEAERALGVSRAELLGGDLWELFPHARGSAFEREYREAVATGRPTGFEAYYPPPLDTWYEVRAWPAPDGLSVYFHDITARRRAQAQLEQAAARSTLLAQVVADVAGTLDVREAVSRLMRLVVPGLADWCVVALFDDGADPARPRLLDVGWWHHDPALRPVVERYATARLAELSDRTVPSAAATTTAPLVLQGRATEAIAAHLEPGEALDALRRLDPADCVLLPMRAHGRTLGLMTLFGDVVDRGSGRPPGAGHGSGEHAVEIAAEVAARAALALDNARLYGQQRRVAEELQRSLLSSPPTVEHVEIEVRYQPAAEAAKVGGDWYDAFRPRPDVTTLVIGDVAGHDIAAAATMGQIRAMLRGIAAGSPKGPAAVLTRLDEVLEILAVEVAATALVAQLEHTTQDCERGQVRLTWSSAGHPPPMVIGPDGVVAELDQGTIQADLLLGVDSSYPRTEHEVTLPVGSTLLLYTDGLVERRREPYRSGMQRLSTALAKFSGLPLAALCDAVLTEVLPEQPGDDVALAAVRIS